MIEPIIFAMDWSSFSQYVINGLTIGALFALIALGYTMVYGIVELINFAHGDLFMLGCFLALSILWMIFGVEDSQSMTGKSTSMILLCLFLMFLFVPLFCAALNVGVEYSVYRPLRNAPKLAPLVSAIGVSFIFMNIGLFWGGPKDVSFPDMLGALEQSFFGTGGQGEGAVQSKNLLGTWGEENNLSFTFKQALIFAVTVPLMIALTLFVQYSRMGKAMRATAQNPTAAQLMGINSNTVISTTFGIGGALAGFGSIMYSTNVGTVGYQMGFQNGLYAFTAAVLGGIGNIPGAVLGGLIIGLVRSLGSAYVGENWTSALVFVALIVILIFRPSGLLGSRVREKV